MRKILILILGLFSGINCNSQDGLTLTDRYSELQVIAPSTDMRGIVQFVNTPVSEYTGIPDVKIPLYSINDSNLDFDMQLRYHPNSIKKDERAGTTGLGWNLTAGGSITRVIRGLPDELYGNQLTPPKWGINCSMNDLGNFIEDPTSYSSQGNMDEYDKLFEALEMGKYDTQYDIFYYNFMGYSGSFYIKVNNSLSNLAVVKLEKTPLKISVSHSLTQGGNTYKINSFTIVDENGNKYLFDVKEDMVSLQGYSATRMFSSWNLQHNLNDNFPIFSNPYNNHTIFTSFHLSEVIPYKRRHHGVTTSPLIKFYYEGYTESYRDYQEINKELLSTVSNMSNTAYMNYIQNHVTIATSWDHGWDGIRDMFGNKKTRNVTHVYTNTKKISRIVYNDNIIMDFSYEKGRLDNGYTNRDSIVKLTNINIFEGHFHETIGYTEVNKIKSIDFDYSYTNYEDKKMLLKKVTEYKNTPNDEQKRIYRLHYNREDSYLGTMKEDKWGFYGGSDYSINTGNMMSFLLNKMELPTGGAIIYHYEPNDYSYIGNMAQYEFKTRKTQIGGGIRIKTIGYFDNKNVPQNYYIQNDTIIHKPLKEVNYNYNLDNGLSSGSLVFPIPLFEYTRWYDLFESYTTYGGEFAYLQPDHSGSYKYKIKTERDNLFALTTKGGNVGYKQVTIKERGNGKRVLKYTSPIDFPEENYTQSYPFLPSSNLDYKRGLLLNESIYNNNNELIRKIENTYEYQEDEISVGVIPFYRHGHNCRRTVAINLLGGNNFSYEMIGSPYGGHPGFAMIDASAYYDGLDYCTVMEDLMNYEIEKRVVGWAKLAKTEYTDYLTSPITNTIETTYYSTNMLPRTTQKTIGSDIYSTEYEYLNVSTSSTIAFNFYNRISDVKKKTVKLNGEILSTEKVSFKNINESQIGGGSLLGTELWVPKEYQYAKGNNDIETLYEITKMDIYGNPIETKDANGVYTSYIWAYKGAKLLAIIKNAQHSYLENLSEYSSILDIGNGGIFGGQYYSLEMINNLYDGLRLQLNDSMYMTSFAYNIGVGIACVIDANGRKTYYNYNTLNNISQIIDNESIIIKTYTEKYKN